MTQNEVVDMIKTVLGKDRLKNEINSEDGVLEGLVKAFEKDEAAVKKYFMTQLYHPNDQVRLQTRNRVVMLVMVRDRINIASFLFSYLVDNIWRIRFDVDISKKILTDVFQSCSQSLEFVLSYIEQEIDIDIQRDKLIDALQLFDKNLLECNHLVFHICQRILLGSDDTSRSCFIMFIKQNGKIDIFNFLKFFLNTIKSDPSHELIFLDLYANALSGCQVEHCAIVMAEYLDMQPTTSLERVLMKLSNGRFITPAALTRAKQIVRAKIRRDVHADEQEAIEHLRKIQYFSTSEELVETMRSMTHFLLSEKPSTRLVFAMTLVTYGYDDGRKYQGLIDKDVILQYVNRTIPGYGGVGYPIDLFEIEIALQLIQNFLKVESTAEQLIGSRNVERLQNFSNDLIKYATNSRTKIAIKIKALEFVRCITNFLDGNKHPPMPSSFFRNSKPVVFSAMDVYKLLNKHEVPHTKF